MSLEKFKLAETDENRTRKLNALLDALGLLDGDTLAPSVLPVATATTLGAVKDGTGVTVAGDGTLSVP